MKNFKPMLAAKTDGKNLRYPLLASPKLDGVRAIVIDGVVMSRALKPIPNKLVQARFGHHKYNGLDGELIVGDITDKDVYRKTVSGVMSEEGRPIVFFYIFDRVSNRTPDDANRFKTRLCSAGEKAVGLYCMVLSHIMIHKEEELVKLEEKWLAEGYEGVMLRDPAGLYKFGRSTKREGGLLKLKRFEDSEAEVLGVVELMHNDNPKKLNELGKQQRSSHKANKRGGGKMGALHVRDLKTGVEFDIGTGFTDSDRSRIWDQHCMAGVYTQGGEPKWRVHPVVGQILKYKYFPTGSKDKPRFPVFLGWRSTIDL